MAKRQTLEFEVNPQAGVVSALLLLPPDPKVMLVLAHGAGAGMNHPFMEALSTGLADNGVATFRFQFPYMEAGRRAPDRSPKLTATVRTAVATARCQAPGVPVIAGGKSMGGRMTSMATAEHALVGVKGLVFFGFPLHQPGKFDLKRAEHLAQTDVRLLFLQGTRDRLARLDLIERMVRELGPRATLRVVEGADHGFHVLKRSGRTDTGVLSELINAACAWAKHICLQGASKERPS